MTTTEKLASTESLLEIAELLELTTTGLDMRHYFPHDVPAGRGCGIYFGVCGGVHTPVGGGELAEINHQRLHLKGKFKFLNHEGNAEVVSELATPGSARLRIPALFPEWMNAKTWAQGKALHYHVLDGPMQGAQIKQIFANATWISGAYVEFHITFNSKHYEVKYWFNKG
jgi:hypothetical protein